MAVLLLVAAPLVAHATSSLPRFRNETELVILAVLGGLAYGGLVVALFGRRLLSFIRRRSVVKSSVPPAAEA
jgi:NhaP-type Na+/H+ or K+/H+ antiporter